MTVFEGSRYAGCNIEQVLGRDGQWHAVLDAPTLTPAPFATPVVLPAGARYDTAASILFNDTEQWWRIAVQNPLPLYPDELPIGMVAQFPNPTAVVVTRG